MQTFSGHSCLPNITFEASNFNANTIQDTDPHPHSRYMSLIKQKFLCIDGEVLEEATGMQWTVEPAFSILRFWRGLP